MESLFIKISSGQQASDDVAKHLLGAKEKGAMALTVLFFFLKKRKDWQVRDVIPWPHKENEKKTFKDTGKSTQKSGEKKAL